jgi:hypothetical protein
MRQWRWPVVLLCALGLVFTACAAKKTSETSAAPAPATDDDDDGSPPPLEPWNQTYPRPIVTIASPQSGAFIDGPAVTIQGSVSGATVAEVTINDQTVPVNDGAFEADESLPAGQTVVPFYITAVSTGAAAEPVGAAEVVVFQGTSQPPAQTVTDAVGFALGNDALTVVNDLLDHALTDLNLLPLFDKLNPIVNVAGVKVEVIASSIGAATGAAAFGADGLGIQGALADVKLGLKITIGAGQPISMLTTIGSFNFQGVTDLTVADGKATATVSNFALSQSDISFSGPLSDIIGAALVGLLLDGIEDVVKLAVDDLAPPLLEKILEAVNLNTKLGGWDLQLALTDLEIVTGALAADFELNAYVVAPDPTLPWPQGSLSLAGAGPDMANYRPAAAQNFAFGAALSENLLNRILFSAANAKLFNLSIDSLTAGTVSLLFPSLATVDPSTPVSLVFSPMTPPVALAAADGSLTVNFPDWRLDVYLNPPGVAPWRAMELTFAIVFGVEGQAQDGKLALSFPTASLAFHYIDNPLNDDASLVSFLAQWLPGILQGVLNVVFDELHIGLPTIDGVTIDTLWWGVAGPDLDYWTSYFDMTYTPPAR